GRALRDLVARGTKGGRVDVTTRSASAPRNVILLVGDGMGTAAVTATYYHRGGLAMNELRHHGIVTTHALDSLVNDSPGSATALGTGRRTLGSAVGMAPGDDGALVAVE